MACQVRVGVSLKKKKKKKDEEKSLKLTAFSKPILKYGTKARVEFCQQPWQVGRKGRLGGPKVRGRGRRRPGPGQADAQPGLLLPLASFGL